MLFISVEYLEYSRVVAVHKICSAVLEAQQVYLCPFGLFLIWLAQPNLCGFQGSVEAFSALHRYVSD